MNNLIRGDCVEVMKTLEPHSIDCLIADPPYNISRKTNFSTMNSHAARIGMDFGEWDKGFDVTGWIAPMSNLLKENANVVIFNCWENLYLVKQECAKNHITIKRCLVINKTNPVPYNRDRMFVNDVEFALWGVYNSKDKPTKWTFNRKDTVEKCVMSASVQSSKLHPTMKSLKIITKLVDLLTNEGDVVLDPFMGSGTTGVACKDLNRNFIGIELDENYFNVANKRINGEI